MTKKDNNAETYINKTQSFECWPLAITLAGSANIQVHAENTNFALKEAIISAQKRI